MKATSKNYHYGNRVMKKCLIAIIVLSLLHVQGLPASAKKARLGKVSCVYSTASNHVELTGMDRCDSATVIHFRIKNVPGSKFKIPDQLYLSDSQDKRYQLKRSDGIKPGKTETFPLADYVDFSLTFEPLPHDEWIFDLLSADEVFRWFAFWGITDRNIPKKFSKIKDTEAGCQDETWVKAGTAFVKGRFIGKYHPDSLNLYMPFTGNLRANPHVMVKEDGTFEIERQLPGMTWTYLENPIVSRFPLFLIPGDTLKMTIHDCDTPSMRISYESAKGNDVHGKLMNADPLYINAARYVVHPEIPMRPCELREMAEDMKENEHRLWQYIVWKYRLCSMDAHLLNLYMQSLRIDLLSSCANQSVFKAMPLKRLTENGLEGISKLKSAEVEEYYWFLKDVDIDDMCVMATPYQYIVQSIVENHPAKILYPLQGQKESFLLLERYLGKPLNDIWKQIVNNKQAGE